MMDVSATELFAAIGVAASIGVVLGAAALLRSYAARGLAQRERDDIGRALAASEAVSAALSEEALFLAAVLSAVDAVIVLVDRDGRVQFVNDRFTEIFGVDVLTVTGKPVAELRRAIAGCFRDPEAYVREAQAAEAPRASSERSEMTRMSGIPAPDEAELDLARPARRVLLRSARPVVRGEGSIGTLIMFRDITRQREIELAREELLRDVAAAAKTDAVTGLANRRAATEAIVAEVERARRYDRPLAVAMLDIDHFKSVNDEHGHEAGDRVLSAFARVLRSTARATDFVARWGGEEFLAVLHEADIEAAQVFAQRVREELARAAPLREVAVGQDGGPPVTVSTGVAALDVRGGETADALLRRADGALYEAKRAGRDRVAAARAPVTATPSATAPRARAEPS